MILSDIDINARIAAGDIAIEPFDAATQLQPASVDLRLGPEVINWHRPHDEDDDAIDVAKPTPERMTSKYTAKPDGITGGAILLRSGEFMLGTTIERVRIPPTLAARVEGRSSIGRLGIAVHVTAGFIDPGFEGQITLEIVNFNPRAIWIRPGMRIAQLVFHELRTPATPYRGKYQGQTGTTASRAHVDFAPRTHDAPHAYGVPLSALPDRMLEHARGEFARRARVDLPTPNPFVEFGYALDEPTTLDEAEAVREAEAAFRKLEERVDGRLIEQRIRDALGGYIGTLLTHAARMEIQIKATRVFHEIAKSAGVTLTPREMALLAQYAVALR